MKSLSLSQQFREESLSNPPGGIPRPVLSKYILDNNKKNDGNEWLHRADGGMDIKGYSLSRCVEAPCAVRISFISYRGNLELLQKLPLERQPQVTSDDHVEINSCRSLFPPRLCSSQESPRLQMSTDKSVTDERS